MAVNIRAFFANPKRILYVLGFAVAIFLILVVWMIISRFSGGGGGGEVILQFWGPIDDASAYQPATETFYKLHNKRVRVEYTRISTDDYEERLLNALASGRGPDIFLIHHTWVNKHADKLLPITDNATSGETPLKTVKQYKSEFVDVAYDDFVRGNKIYAFPLYADTLALYYNKDLLNTAGITRPPATWDEFNRDVELMTKIDERGNFTQMGAAIGAAHNINRSTDILMNLMIQSGVQMTDVGAIQPTFARQVNDQPVGEKALQYYTDFTNPAKRVYTWGENLHYSVDAFAEGRVGMMINYSYQIDFLRNKNARLNFAVAPMPQVNPDDIKSFANYWAPAISLSTRNAKLAWEFVEYLTSNDGVRAYLAETRRPSARRDIIELQRNDTDIGVFAVQALSAKSWAQVDNVAIEKIFMDMIDDVNLGRRTIMDALKTAEVNTALLFSKQRRLNENLFGQ